MSDRKWGFRTQDMINSIEEIESFAQKHSLESFSRDKAVFRATERNLEIIAEASKFIPEEVKNEFSYPWGDIIGMRNIIAHNYGDVEIPLIWSTVKEDLPVLKKVLLEIRKKYGGDIGS